MKKPDPKFRSKSWNNLSILKSIPIIWMIVFRNLVIGRKRLTSLTRSKTKMTTVLLIMTPMLKGLLMCNLRLNVCILVLTAYSMNDDREIRLKKTLCLRADFWAEICFIKNFPSLNTILFVQNCVSSFRFFSLF